MRKAIALTILALTLLTVSTRSGQQSPLLYVILFVLGLGAYLVAVSFLFAAAGSAASPILVIAAIWLYLRRRKGKPAPRWIKSLRRRVAKRSPVLARITASGRAAKHAWRQNTRAEPAACGDRVPDTQDGATAAA